MKLLTLNCHSWIEENQIYKIKHLAKTIAENDYDVIAFQEVSQKLDSDRVGKNIKKHNFGLVLIEELRLLNSHDYNYIWDYSHIGYDIYEEGIAILTKHKIKDKESFYVSKSEDFKFWKSRKVVKTTIEIDCKEYDFISCHLGWWHDEEEPFKYQVDTLLKNIDFNKTTFLMGDFNNNANVKNEGYDYLLSKGLIDTYNKAKFKDDGITVRGSIDGWSEDANSKRLDLVLANKNIEVKSSKVIFNGKNKEVVSDHYGVEVIIE
ncbi:endonuclease/exonuclease/phosphatase family protein [Clostridium sp.]|uniref:endonuclease/exonuclease/phosphatase family protein n=1 Tax=Clostridium sp. TaxID=1506 RepID=UPI003F2D28BC